MSNYQVKVNNTQKYSDSQGEHIVCEGKLVFIYAPFNNGTNIKTVPMDLGSGIFSSIIISETEEIEVGDWVYGMDGLFEYKGKVSIDNGRLPNKILALPEHFSDKHLQAIVDGKIKGGDEVLVKCDFIPCQRNSEGTCIEDHNCMEWGIHNKKEQPPNTNCDKRPIIGLGKQNHITLFPVKQSLEEAAKEYEEEYEIYHGISSKHIKLAFEDGAKWAKKNNY